MRTLIATLISSAGLLGLVLVSTPAVADDEVIERRTEESMHVETAPAPVVRERVIERQAPAAVVQHKSKETIVKGDVDDDDDADIDDDDEDVDD